METAKSTLALLPETSIQRNSFAESLINDIVTGNVNGLDVDYRMKLIEDTFSMVRKNESVKAQVLADCENESNTKNTFDYRDATIQIKSLAKWDYSGCGLWNELKRQEEELAEKRKKLEQIMQNIQSEMADAETGEIISPAVCTTSKTIAYKFKK